MIQNMKQWNRKKAGLIAGAVIVAVVLILIFSLREPGGNDPNESRNEAIADVDQAQEATQQPDAEEAPVPSLVVDFGVRSDPPLLKKIAQYNSGIPLMDHYERDLGHLPALDAQSFRLDLGLGAGLDRDFLGRNVISGSAESPEYDFSQLDKLAKMLNEQEVLPYYSWAYVPLPLQRDADFRKLDTTIPDWESKYRDMLRTAAAHFRDNNIRIGYHEIYNEPDLTDVFFQEPFSNYLKLYRAGSVGMKEGDPDAMIGGPALASPEFTTNVMDFLEMVDKENLPLDFFSFHEYWESAPFWGKLANVRRVMEWYDRFKTTEIHLNELNVLGGWQGESSPLNHFEIAPRIFDVISEVLKASDVTIANWAQFMESTAGDDAYGLIHRDGQKKAAYHVFKIYADMPEERVLADWGDDWESAQEIGTLASGNSDKVGVVLWNRTEEDRRLKLTLNQLPFAADSFRVYRIDGAHASFFDGAPEELEAEAWEAASGPSGEKVWEIDLPANGVIYITADAGSGAQDFDPRADEHLTAADIRTHYYFEQRDRDNYSYFDRKTWRFYLGMGSQETARSLVGVTAKELPEALNVTTSIGGDLQALSGRSAAAMRLDFETKDGYTDSVVFHGGLYPASQGADGAFPFGTLKEAGQIVEVDNFGQFEVKLADYAPEGWNSADGRVLISFELCDTGVSTRLEAAIR